MFYSRSSRMLTLIVLLEIILPWRTIREARAASQQSKAALPAATCPIAALATWTPQETWVWSQVCRGKAADFNTALDSGEKLSPKELKGWQSQRVLRSIFLEAILLYEPFRSVLPRQGVHIIGAWFQEPLDLAYATLVHRLAIEGSRFEADIDLTALRTADIVDLSGSTVLGSLYMPGLHTSSVLYLGKEATFTTINFVDANVDGRIDLSTATVTGHLDMNGLHVGGVLFMNEKATFATVDLIHAKVDGMLDLSTATVTGHLDMNGLRVGGVLFMNEKATFATVDLASAKVGGRLYLDASTVTGELGMNGLHVSSDVFMNEKATFATVDLINAKVDGALVLSAATVTGKLDMNGLHVGRSLLLRDKATFATVVLDNAQVDGALEMDTATVTGKLDMSGLHVGRSLFLRNKATFATVDLSNAKVDGVLDLSTATVTGELNMHSLHVGSDVFMYDATFVQSVKLLFATIGSGLDLGGAVLPSLDLTETRISGELNLVPGKLAAESPSNAHWILRNTEVGGVQDTRTAWPKTLTLDGFTYRRLGRGAVEDTDSMPAREIAWWKDWLEKQHGYTPQPYEQVASVLQKAGYQSKATAILYESKQRERAELWYRKGALWWVQWGWFTLQWLFIGYGYYTFVAMGWVVFFWFLGVCALWISGQARAHDMPYGGMAYSLDMLLPGIHLRKEHYERIDLQGKARVYFYIHRLLGYLLVFFVVAGLTGLTKK